MFDFIAIACRATGFDFSSSFAWWVAYDAIRTTTIIRTMAQWVNDNAVPYTPSLIAKVVLTIMYILDGRQKNNLVCVVVPFANEVEPAN